jgi:hypothetical protein
MTTLSRRFNAGHLEGATTRPKTTRIRTRNFSRVRARTGQVRGFLCRRPTKRAYDPGTESKG